MIDTIREESTGSVYTLDPVTRSLLVTPILQDHTFDINDAIPVDWLHIQSGEDSSLLSLLTNIHNQLLSTNDQN